MKKLTEEVFIEWLKAAFDYEKLRQDYEVEEELEIVQDGFDRCFGLEDETFQTGPFFRTIGIWIDRGTAAHDEAVDKEKLLCYSGDKRYYIEPGTQWYPFQVYLRFIEENIDALQRESEEEMEQTAKISLRDFLNDETDGS